MFKRLQEDWSRVSKVKNVKEIKTERQVETFSAINRNSDGFLSVMRNLREF